MMCGLVASLYRQKLFVGDKFSWLTEKGQKCSPTGKRSVNICHKYDSNLK